MPRSPRWSLAPCLLALAMLAALLAPSMTGAQPGTNQPPGFTPDSNTDCGAPPGQPCAGDTQQPSPTPDGDSICDVPPGQTCPGDTQQPSPTPPAGNEEDPSQPGFAATGIPDAGRWMGGPERAGEMPGPGIGEDPPRVLWKTPIGSGAVVSAPVVANGLVYLTSGGVVYAYHTESGLPAWKSDPDYNAVGQVEVMNGVVYGYSGHGWIFSIDAGSGAPIAAIEHPAAGAASFFVVANEQIHLALGSTLAAIDPLTFTERWSIQLPGYANGLAVSGDTIVIGANGTILGLDASTGQARWQTLVVASADAYGSYGGLQTAIAGDLVFVNSTINELVYALSLADGHEVWSAPSPGIPTGNVINGYFYSTPLAVGEGVVVFPSALGHLTALSAQDHTNRWSFQAEHSTYGYANQIDGGGIATVKQVEYRSPVIAGDMVYVGVWSFMSWASSAGSGEAEPKPVGISAFSLETGQELWFTDLAHPAADGLAIVDEMLIGANADGVFALVSPGFSGNDGEGNDGQHDDEEDPPGGTGGDASSYVDAVRAHNDALVASVARAGEILSQDEVSDADQDEFAGILQLWESAPGQAEAMTVPDGMADIQAVYKAAANAYGDAAAAVFDLAEADPGSAEAGEAQQAFRSALDTAVALSSSLDTLLSTSQAIVISR